MYRYILKRILFLIPTILGVVFIIFFVLNLTPGNPGRSILGVSAPQEAVDQLNEELGYNDPLLVKYFNYLKNLVLNRSFGTSYFTGQAVADEVLPRFGVTLKLSTIGIIVSTLVGVPLGILTAVKQYSIWDYVPSVLAFLLAAIPSFVLGMVLLFVFALKLNILPSYGLETWKCYIMPSLCMAIPITAFNVRFTKSSMLESIREDYIEDWLFTHLQEEIDKCMVGWEVKAAERKKQASRSADKAALKRKLTKLKELYVDDLISIEDYKKDYKIYTEALQNIPDVIQEMPPNLSAVRRVLDDDFKAIYDSLSREEKRTLWRSIISEIKVDRDNNITDIIFS